MPLAIVDHHLELVEKKLMVDADLGKYFNVAGDRSDFAASFSAEARIRVYVTQPTRMACRQLATFLGTLISPMRVGYAYSGCIGFTEQTEIVFVTPGFLLPFLVLDSDAGSASPSAMSRWPTDIVVDEAHIRTTDLDLLLMWCRDRLSGGEAEEVSARTNFISTNRGGLRSVIVMSATMETPLLQNYFSKVAQPICVNLCPIDARDQMGERSNSVPPSSYRNTVLSLGDLDKQRHPQLTGELSSMIVSSQLELVVDDLQLLGSHFRSSSELRRPTELSAIQAMVLARCVLRLSTAARERRGVLVFVPGFADMVSLAQAVLTTAAEANSPSVSSGQTSSRSSTGSGFNQQAVWVKGGDAIGDFDVDGPASTSCSGGNDAMTMKVNGRYVNLLLLHASQFGESTEQIDRINSPSAASEDQRTIIIATNVAESSVTLSNVGFVVDLGSERFVRHDERTGTLTTSLRYASLASLTQRRGRTGRTCDGIVIRLFSDKVLTSVATFDLPETLRESPTSLLLRIKLLSASTSSASGGDGERNLSRLPLCSDVIERLLSPPTRTALEIAASDAVSKQLITGPPGASIKKCNEMPGGHDGPLGLFASSSSWTAFLNDSQLTARGRFAASLPIDPNLALLVYSGLQFGVVCECILLAAALATPNLFFSRDFHSSFSQQEQQQRQHVQEGTCAPSPLSMTLEILSAKWALADGELSEPWLNLCILLRHYAGVANPLGQAGSYMRFIPSMKRSLDVLISSLTARVSRMAESGEIHMSQKARQQVFLLRRAALAAARHPSGKVEVVWTSEHKLQDNLKRRVLAAFVAAFASNTMTAVVDNRLSMRLRANEAPTVRRNVAAFSLYFSPASVDSIALRGANGQHEVTMAKFQATCQAATRTSDVKRFLYQLLPEKCRPLVKSFRFLGHNGRQTHFVEFLEKDEPTEAEASSDVSRLEPRPLARDWQLDRQSSSSALKRSPDLALPHPGLWLLRYATFHLKNQPFMFSGARNEHEHADLGDVDVVEEGQPTASLGEGDDSVISFRRYVEKTSDGLAKEKMEFRSGALWMGEIDIGECERLGFGHLLPSVQSPPSPPTHVEGCPPAAYLARQDDEKVDLPSEALASISKLSVSGAVEWLVALHDPDLDGSAEPPRFETTSSLSPGDRRYCAVCKIDLHESTFAEHLGSRPHLLSLSALVKQGARHSALAKQLSPRISHLTRKLDNRRLYPCSVPASSTLAVLQLSSRHNKEQPPCAVAASLVSHSPHGGKGHKREMPVTAQFPWVLDFNRFAPSIMMGYLAAGNRRFAVRILTDAAHSVVRGMMVVGWLTVRFRTPLLSEQMQQLDTWLHQNGIFSDAPYPSGSVDANVAALLDEPMQETQSSTRSQGDAELHWCSLGTACTKCFETNWSSPLHQKISVTILLTLQEYVLGKVRCCSFRDFQQRLLVRIGEFSMGEGGVDSVSALDDYLQWRGETLNDLLTLLGAHLSGISSSRRVMLYFPSVVPSLMPTAALRHSSSGP